MKTCKKCNTEKPLSDFGKKTKNKDGLAYDCRDCRRIAKNLWNAANKDKVKASSSKYHNKNSEAINASKRKYYSENTAEELLRVRTWSEANPLKRAASAGRTLATVRGAKVPDNYDIEYTIPFYEEARKLTKETGIPHEVDHIIPISKGGLHCQTNLQVLTKSENASKGDTLQKVTY